MVAKLLSDKQVTYVNLTPAAHTLPILRAQGYLQYSRGVFVAAPAVQLGTRFDGTVVTARVVDAPARTNRFDHELLLDTEIRVHQSVV